MKHIIPLLIKYILVSAILFVIFTMYSGTSLVDILIVSFFLTITTYVIGDLFILSKYGHLAATFGDFGLTYFGTIILGSIFIETVMVYGIVAFFAAVSISIGEWFFHHYLTQTLLTKEKQGAVWVVPSLNFATEFSEEMEVSEVKKAKPDKKIKREKD
ncbi:YndM family protein [Evansella sp. AB-P1]|uniref:YndM family protein n=1 Tax=Evansella sp. AB-P1 TaxID=3037653 RepID=UPI00241FEE18|nr:YndM family protein [Evansella sp. AB-P1]MDG5787165.1 YndM family protein [Evansella sp. AB-P1]